MSRRTAQPHAPHTWPLLLLVPVLTLGTSALVIAAHAATAGHTPFGRIDAVAQPGTGTGVALSGWAIDPDTHSPIQVLVSMDGHQTRLTANIARADVAHSYPAYGTRHGFTGRIPAAAGTHTLCIYAMDYGPGTTNPSLGCRTITLNYNPFGAITAVKQFPGGFTASGWAIDRDLPRPAVGVHITVDGVQTAGTANLPRADVAQRYPAAGAAHGFSIAVHATEGVHRVCLLATNIGQGANATILCRAVGLNFSPVGAITSLTQVAGGFRAQGWALDPDTSAPITVTVLADGRPVGSTVAKLASNVHAGHGFSATYLFGTTTNIPPGVHSVCLHGANLGPFGHIRQLACGHIAVNFNPRAAITAVRQRSPGYQVSGWVQDPDTAAAIHVIVTTDGKSAANVLANRAGAPRAGHNFLINLPAVNGRHTVCAVGVNVSYGSANSTAACAAVTLNFNPFGALERLTRVARTNAVLVTGWAIDPDSIKPSTVRITIDGRVVGTPGAAAARPDVAKAHPGFGAGHGLAAQFAASVGEHRVCATAVNMLGGTGDTVLGCRIINAVHPVVPSAPTAVIAVGGYGRATITWTAPRSDGGAPWTSYTVTSSGHAVAVGATARSATMTGLASRTRYAFSVVATNVAGRSAPGRSAIVLTATNPPPQRSPAPISTSRYVRNISGSSAANLAQMKAEGVYDARHDPSGHGYLLLLDIGGQDQARAGVLLSASTRFVSYADLVRDINAYVDGYASQQKPSAPVIIAIGTNNDMDVSTASGASWARSVVNPVASHASGHVGMRIAGANDIEPGFRGTYAQTSAWLGGYLAATRAPFVFNGSADGCAWTVTGRGCNNGWTMAGLYRLSAGAAPTRIVNLPQIYNNTMAAQWKYISLTGVAARSPRINFGGALTEFTACAQVGGCGSLTGASAWTQMWRQLQSHPALQVGSLPYSTDLRIDR